MISQLRQVQEFHETFGSPVGDYTRPSFPNADRRELRTELIVEEFCEYLEAVDADDIVGVADALADLLYVINGCAVEHGIDLDRVFAEVHRSNMSKLWPDGTVHYREDGKVLKPPTYSPADVFGVLF